MIRNLGILAVLALYLLVSTSADSPPAPPKFSENQKYIYDLLWHIDQPDKVHPKLYKTGISFNIKNNLELYDDKVAVKEFLDRFEYGMIPRGRIVSIFDERHLEEAISLFKLFYAAKDLQTFFNTAAWARVHMNENLFIYSFYVAIFRRPDTRGFRLPLLAEVTPWKYFNADVMQQIYDQKLSVDPHNSTTDTVIVYGNYTYSYDSNTRDPETKLSYLREDVGLNSYYALMNQEFPFWMGSTEEYKIPAKYRGELYYYMIKFFYDRYNMERYSHGMPEVEFVDLDRPILTGFTPALKYRNGFQYPQRKEWSSFPSHMFGYLQKAKEFEARITAAIDFGQFGVPTEKSESIYNQYGLNMLGNIVTGNADSINRKYYGAIEHFFRILFGFSPEPYSKYQLLPSALEHYSTTFRDPAIFRIFKKLLSYFEDLKKHMGPYTYDEINSKGIEFESVTVDKLVTFFDSSDSFASSVYKVHDEQDADSMIVKVRQYRLNHKQFSYHFTIKSDKDTKVTVRIFLGPKYNFNGQVMPISESYKYFYQIDQFITDVKAGSNKIERKSTESPFTSPDYISSDVYYQKILQSIENDSELPSFKPYGFPDRLILPKGRPEGLPVQFFFYVTEFEEDKSVRFQSPVLGDWYHDNAAFGVPLDRPIYGHNFTTPNMHIKTVHIYHKEEADSNLTV